AQLFTDQVGDVPRLAQETKTRRAAHEAVDLNAILETVAVEPATSRDDHGVHAAGFQLVYQSDAGALQEFEEMRTNCHWLASPEGAADAGLGGQEALRLDPHARQRPLQRGQVQRGVTVAPATHETERRPDSRGVLRADACQLRCPPWTRTHVGGKPRANRPR